MKKEISIAQYVDASGEVKMLNIAGVAKVSGIDGELLQVSGPEDVVYLIVNRRNFVSMEVKYSDG